jgi:hypothetical protein
VLVFTDVDSPGTTVVSEGMVVVSVGTVVFGVTVVSVGMVVDVSVIIVLDVSVISVSRAVVSALTVVSLMPVIPCRVVVSAETPVVTLPVEVSVTTPVVSIALVVSRLRVSEYTEEVLVSTPLRVVVSYGVASAPVDEVVSYAPCCLVTGMRCCETAGVVSALALAVSAVFCAAAVPPIPKANAAAAPIVKYFAECRGIIWSSSKSRP